MGLKIIKTNVMKKGIVIVLLILLHFTFANGQVVESSCEAHDSIVEKYQDDADVLTLRKFYENDLPWADSIEIPDEHSDTVLNALLSVWNAEGLAARDTIVDMLDIHSRELYAVNLIYVGADSTLAWMQELESGSLPCGNDTLDSLITRYSLDIVEYLKDDYDILHWARFDGAINLNMGPLGRLIKPIYGVQYVDTLVNTVLDGDRIDCSINSEFIELIYSYGWGDCLNGCMYRRYWEFRVYYDCSVEFIDSYGNALPFGSVGIQPKSPPVEIYPNPANDYVKIKGIGEQDIPFEYAVYNTAGVKVFSGKNIDASINFMSVLNNGLYILELNTKEKTIRKKIQIVKN
jgi:hypothetical protein